MGHFPNSSYLVLFFWTSKQRFADITEKSTDDDKDGCNMIQRVIILMIMMTKNEVNNFFYADVLPTKGDKQVVLLLP